MASRRNVTVIESMTFVEYVELYSPPVFETQSTGIFTVPASYVEAEMTDGNEEKSINANAIINVSGKSRIRDEDTDVEISQPAPKESDINEPEQHFMLGALFGHIKSSSRQQTAVELRISPVALGQMTSCKLKDALKSIGSSQSINSCWIIFNTLEAKARILSRNSVPTLLPSSRLKGGGGFPSKSSIPRSTSEYYGSTTAQSFTAAYSDRGFNSSCDGDTLEQQPEKPKERRRKITPAILKLPSREDLKEGLQQFNARSIDEEDECQDYEPPQRIITSQSARLEEHRENTDDSNRSEGELEEETRELVKGEGQEEEEVEEGKGEKEEGREKEEKREEVEEEREEEEEGKERRGEEELEEQEEEEEMPPKRKSTPASLPYSPLFTAPSKARPCNSDSAIYYEDDEMSKNVQNDDNASLDSGVSCQDFDLEYVTFSDPEEERFNIYKKERKKKDKRERDKFRHSESVPDKMSEHLKAITKDENKEGMHSRQRKLTPAVIRNPPNFSAPSRNAKQFPEKLEESTELEEPVTGTEVNESAGKDLQMALSPDNADSLQRDNNRQMKSKDIDSSNASGARKKILQRKSYQETETSDSKGALNIAKSKQKGHGVGKLRRKQTPAVLMKQHRFDAPSQSMKTESHQTLAEDDKEVDDSEESHSIRGVHEKDHGTDNTIPPKTSSKARKKVLIRKNTPATLNMKSLKLGVQIAQQKSFENVYQEEEESEKEDGLSKEKDERNVLSITEDEDEKPLEEEEEEADDSDTKKDGEMEEENEDDECGRLSSLCDLPDTSMYQQSKIAVTRRRKVTPIPPIMVSTERPSMTRRQSSEQDSIGEIEETEFPS
ncbi:uncharacterized protein LOC144450934 [Glandiceps talaboti]